MTSFFCTLIWMFQWFCCPKLFWNIFLSKKADTECCSSVHDDSFDTYRVKIGLSFSPKSTFEFLWLCKAVLNIWMMSTANSNHKWNINVIRKYNLINIYFNLSTHCAKGAYMQNTSYLKYDRSFLYDKTKKKVSDIFYRVLHMF